ncbi:glycoside hydrolase family 3 N-terminal domain-containing protein [Lysobacter yananisis]|uniref:beta-glucosidase n=1 Tax=Lysobacter yananisis TaxID=1003114 RepID=A0ABY9P5C2_9GAMM|nr:glycoside hydrolase family 3 N-terminal domain-containing protein [Lysobacter yananisis]WMT02179.1 glycoside hydrolase family 3 N-terminal domain-containing protein [Lysobacter yananisis]
MADRVDIDALIARMTLQEKIGQLSVLADSIRPFAFDVNPDSFQWGPQRTRELIQAGEVGALFNGVGAAEGRELQRIAVEESRLGIPLLLGADVIHGMRTVFPIPLGEAASFEPELAERTARAAAIEATREGLHWTFAPVVDIARDQRWGRVAETTGEDTFLACAFARARVRGFQGPDLTADDSLLATPKHFAAYGAVAAGLDYNTVDLAPQTLFDVHLPPFKAAIDAGALTVMSSFNDINGVPATANRELLTGILREQWGFEGFVVSDYTSDFELIEHGFAADEKHAAQLSLDAGLDMSMQSGVYMDHLRALVEEGKVATATLDTAVRRILSVKARMGLFDNPYRSLTAPPPGPAPYLDAHDALARDAARRSVVMLKNDGETLPLRKSGQRIALIGPFARDRENLAGCWNIFGDSSREIDLETGLRAALADPASLQVVDGCGMEEAIDGGIEAALAAARGADAVLLAVGEPTRYTGEAQSRTQIVLPAAQQALAEAVIGAGTPVIVLLRNGRALALSPALQAAPAILVTWFLGTQTGHAVADLVFGDHSPSGRLPISFPHDSGQQPYYYNHTSSGRPYQPGTGLEAFRTRWRETANTALYPFGHGLGYTRFEYGAVELSAAGLAWDGRLQVRARIANVGQRPGEEVVQLYLRDRVASRVRPIRELKGFQKIALAPGESRVVEFVLTRADLEFRGVDNRLVAEPGWFDLWVAPSADAGEPVAFELLAFERPAFERPAFERPAADADRG